MSRVGASLTRLCIPSEGAKTQSDKLSSIREPLELNTYNLAPFMGNVKNTPWATPIPIIDCKPFTFT